MGKMRIRAAAFSERGRVRDQNEDNLYVDGHIRAIREGMGTFRMAVSGESQASLFAVCDGMGGEALGEEASYLAVAKLGRLEQLLRRRSDILFETAMADYLREVNADICERTRENHGRRLGSTFSAVFLRDGWIQAVNLGDSPIFLFREGRLHRLSVPQTAAQRLLEMGVITEAEQENHPDRHRLTQHLGIFPEEAALEAKLSQALRLRTGDRILLSSDGLTEMLRSERVTELLAASAGVEAVGNRLINAALRAGGRDNVTVLLIQIDGIEGFQEAGNAMREAWTAAGQTLRIQEQKPREETLRRAPTGVYPSIGQERPYSGQTVALGAAIDAAPAAYYGTDEAGRSGGTEPSARPAAPALSAEDEARFEAARQAAMERRSAVERAAMSRHLRTPASDFQSPAEVSERPEASAVQLAQTERELRRQRQNRRRLETAPTAGRVLARSLLLMVLTALAVFILLYLASSL